MHRLLVRMRILLVCLAFGSNVCGQIPAGYYDAAAGLHGYELKTALYNIIHGHSELLYGDLYSYFVYTDSKPGNVVWDMYSDVPGGSPAYIYYHTPADQCGSYSAEGDCYNREHIVPSSWFNSGIPMYSDLFNLVPVDGFVNNKRGNYPLAQVGIASWTSTNGSRVGNCITSGYTSTVFEPLDDYKGDLARSILYMATCYENVVAGWAGNSNAGSVLAGNDSSVFHPWYVTLLLSWHDGDPVSSKEIARNDSVYKYQHNRNPYIDHPEWVNEVWAYTGSVAETAYLLSVAMDVSPNPARDVVYIDLPGTEANSSIRLFDVTGSNVLSRHFDGSPPVCLDISGLPGGLYFVFALRGDHIAVSKLIIK